MVAGIALASGTVFAGSTDGKVYALRASDGRKRWDFPTGGPVRSQIAVAGGIAYVGSNDGRAYALK
jgi:eukaryotic-like serine/threonine-protein kinase